MHTTLRDLGKLAISRILVSPRYAELNPVTFELVYRLAVVSTIISNSDDFKIFLK